MAMTQLTKESMAAELIEMEAWVDMMAAMPEQTKAMLGAGSVRIGEALSVSARNLPLVTFNRVMGFGLGKPGDRRALDEIAEHMRQASAPVAQIQIADFAVSEGVETMLSDSGFTRAKSNWAKMGRRTEDIPAVETSLAIAEATHDTATAFGQAIAGGFGMPPFFVPWLAALVGRERWHCYIARDGEEIVAGGALYLSDSAAWLGAAATLPQARERGAQGALIARRIADAAAHGRRWAYTETGILDGPNPSLANMYRTGFQCLHERMNWSLVPQ